MILPAVLSGLLAFAAPDPGQPAATEIWQLDSSRSQASFSVRVLWLFPVEGRFDQVAGQVHVDRHHQRAWVQARIQAGSVSMQRRGTETWVKSEEFFDVAHHPDIVFESEIIPLARLYSGGDLPGQLTMRGVRQPVLFTLSGAACRKPAIDCAVEASGSVHRTDFGMRSRRGTLADKVELSMSIRAIEAVPADHRS